MTRLELWILNRVRAGESSWWENPGIFEAMILCFEERRECYGVDASTLQMREDRGQDLFHAPDLSVRGPLSLVDEGFQHFHEMCSLIHPPERPGSEASCLSKCLHPACARRPLLRSRPIYPLRRSP
ncbi:hypothetical protein Bca52824_054147 [Brassica carinata]|uniref:Uncharacterized protein n=1 Tax=Brassica carinata TaxID=52824 RepID=A0A8X7R815_BRACI|nr:hypothetical protein Bca52824_054147 [Brassica carinata]